MFSWSEFFIRVRVRADARLGRPRGFLKRLQGNKAGQLLINIYPISDDDFLKFIPDKKNRMNLNKVMLIGNLTRDPEVRNTPAGLAVASFSVATNLVWRDAAGNKQQRADYHNVIAWRKLAEICGQYLHKGSKVYIEGRLQTRDWLGQDGVKRYRTEIITDNMIMLDRAGGVTASRGAEEPPLPTEEASAVITVESGGSDEPDEEDIKVENIPF